MPTSTTNYGLIKPGTDDPILIEQLNDNADTIDAALKENADAIENKPDAADIPSPSTAAPAMDGTAAAGTSTDYARADHIHPSDTSKQDALTTFQLAAVNSGIDSAKVGQIETNKANILCNTRNGVKNIFRTPTIDTTSSGINVKTLSDGQLKVTSAGTNTSPVYIDLETSLGSKYVGYKLSGGSAKVGVYISDSSNVTACYVKGNEVSIPSNATNKLFLMINANTPAFEETIYVMIREFGDATYQPYAMSNVELTAAIKAIQAQLAGQ